MSAIHEAKHWFTQLSEDELSAAVALDQRPLYQYAATGSDELHLLFIGTGNAMDRFLRLSIVVGQMLHQTLHIHVLAPDASVYGRRLDACAPGLRQYSNISGAACAQPLVLFDFVDQKALNTARTGGLIRERYLERCRYIVVDLCKKDALLSSLAVSCRAFRHSFIIFHTGSTEVRPEAGLQLYRLDQRNRITDAICVRLSHQAFRLHYHYDRKYGLPNKSREASLREFLGGATGESAAPQGSGARYSQYSNLCAVLHVKYKLASVGIAPNAGRQRIMERCGKRLYGSNRELYEDLTVLEHRRWIMEKLLDGYRAPTVSEMIIHCYNSSDSSDRWWSQNLHFHNCLVGSSPRRVSSLRGLTFSDWEALSGISLSQAEAIRRITASPYDPLDQASLTVHYLAGQKLLALSSRLQSDLSQLSRHIDCALQEGRAAPDYLRRPDEAIRSWMALLTRDGDSSGLSLIISQLEAYADALALARDSVDELREKLRRLARLAREYHSLKDYKAMDEDVIDLLGYIHMSDQAVILKIGAGCSMLDSIASSLLIEPARLVLTDVPQEDAARIAGFFSHRGGFLETGYHPVFPADGGTRTAQLKGLIRSLSRRYDGPLILDLTGASGAEILSITDYVRKNVPDAAVITCDCKTQTIANIHNFPESACIRLKQKLRTDEIFQLIGAFRQQRIDEGDAIRLREESDRFWRFYNSHADRISEINSLLRAMIHYTRENQRRPVLVRRSDPPEYAPFQCFGRSAALFEALHLEEVLRELEAQGAVRELTISRTLGNTVDYSGSILAALLQATAFRNLLELRAQYPLKLCSPSGDAITLDYARQSDSHLYVNADFRYGSYQRLTLQRNRESSSALSDRLQALTQDLRASRAVTDVYLTKKDAVNPTTSMLERVYSLIVPDTEMMYLQYCEGGGSADRNQRIFAYPARSIDAVLRDLESAHLIEDLQIADSVTDGEAAKSVSFLFTSPAALHHLSTPGSFLESRIYAEATNLHIFDHVDTNYKFAWSPDENAAVNEFDVLCVSGLRLLLISAKARDGAKEHLYEVCAMARRLSQTAQPVVVYSDRRRIPDSLLSRARSMGVLVAFAQGGSDDETISAVLRRAMDG